MSEDYALAQMKVDRELEETVRKHGEVQPPRQFEDEFYEKIDLKKKSLAESF